ncbi:MAG: hypothetical protein NVS4B10_19220 [Myxococcales bacterium]
MLANVVELPPQPRATAPLARQVAGRLQAFLRHSGYELASVDARVQGEQILVEVDEGRLSRIVYLGEDAVGTLFFRLSTLLPFNVFNRPQLNRQLDQLKAQFKLRSVRWELVAIGARNEGLPIAALERLRDRAVEGLEQDQLVAPASAFELRIYVEHDQKGGWSPVLGVGGQGLELGVGYNRPHLLAAGDKIEMEGRAGVNERQRLDDAQHELFLSHAGGALRYFTPRLFGTSRLRVFFEGGADVIQRQRADLALNNFRFATVDASANLTANLSFGLELAAGLGLERRWLSGLRPATADTPLLPQVAATPRVQSRLFAALSAHQLLRPQELRYDRKHRIDLTGTFYGLYGDSDPLQGRIAAEYQRVFYFGYHELWLQARGFFLLGAVPFFDEQNVGDVVRGPFGGVYVRQVAGPRIEFRFALLRDILQFGVYDDAAVYGAIDRSTNAASQAFANVLGLAVHALLLDSLQLDVYFGTGFNSQGRVQPGLSLGLQQAY